jgi:hypothetical protein
LSNQKQEKARLYGAIKSKQKQVKQVKQVKQAKASLNPVYSAVLSK